MTNVVICAMRYFAAAYTSRPNGRYFGKVGRTSLYALPELIPLVMEVLEGRVFMI